jgi:site-specific DNA recombinase
MNVVIYTRVSTDEQAKTNLSLENQEKACLDYAERKGYSVQKVFCEEGVSAKTTDRKELVKLIEYCRDNKGNIDSAIVWKVDRFARKAEDHLSLRAMLMKFGVKIESVTEPIEDTNTGRLMETLLAAFAQFDNEVRAERSTSGRNARIAQGGWPNYAPLGYINHKDSINRPTLREDPTRAPLVTKVFEEFCNGTYTQQKITDFAYAIGLRSRKNNKLAIQTIVNMLRNKAYISKIITNDGEEIDTLHKPLVSEEIFYTVQAILSGRSKELRRKKDTYWPLRAGFVTHAHCGRALTGSSPKGRKKHYPKYSCPQCKAADTGKPVSVDREQLHTEFEKLLKAIRPNKRQLLLFKKIVLSRWNEECKDLKERKKQAAKNLELLDTKRQNVLDLFIEGRLSDKEKDEQLAKVETDRVALRLKHSEIDQEVDNREQVIDIAIDFMTNVSNYWRTAPLELQRRFQNLVFPDGITYEFENGFGTAKMSKSYEVIQDMDVKNPSMVAATGIEPVTLGL